MKHLLLSLLLLAVPAPFTIAETNTPKSIEFSAVASQLVIVEYEQNGDYRKALGVVADMGGKPYLLTSQHILLGSSKMSFITASGDKLSPRSIELSSNRDLARLALAEGTDAIELVAEKVKMNTPITVIKAGNDPEKRIEKGKVIGIGGMKFEISTTFDEDSNGAPVLTDEGKLAGLSSHSRESVGHAMKKGTRFEEAKRHFCYRVDTKGWKRVNWRQYNSTFGKPFQEHKKLADRMIRILKDHENRISKKEAAELATAGRTHVRQIDLLLEKKGMTGFLTNELEEYCELFEYAEELFGDYASGK